MYIDVIHGVMSEMTPSLQPNCTIQASRSGEQMRCELHSDLRHGGLVRGGRPTKVEPLAQAAPASAQVDPIRTRPDSRASRIWEPPCSSRSRRSRLYEHWCSCRRRAERLQERCQAVLRPPEPAPRQQPAAPQAALQRCGGFRL